MSSNFRSSRQQLQQKASRMHNISSLRKSVRWSGPVNSNRGTTTEVLEERLEDFLVFELKKDGGSKYLRFNARILYKYVVSAITQRGQNKTIVDDLRSNFPPMMTQSTREKSSTKTPNTKADADHTTNQNIEPSNSETTLASSNTQPMDLPSDNPQEVAPANGPVPSAGEPVPSVLETTKSNASNTSVLSAVEDASPPSRKSKSKRNLSGNRQRADSSPRRHGFEGSPTADHEPITFRERLGGFLHPRDMRRLVTPFSASNEPDIIVRRHVILLNFDPLRAIILRDRLLVLVPDGADSLLVKLEARVRGGTLDIDDKMIDSGNSIVPLSNGSGHEHNLGNKVSLLDAQLNKNGDVIAKAIEMVEHEHKKGTETAPHIQSEDVSEVDDDDTMATDATNNEWDEFEGRDWIDLPFELQCTDACLYIVCELLADDTAELQEATLDYINLILSKHARKRSNEDPLTIVRAMKDAIKEMTSRVKGFLQSMDRILDEDEDMALMNLSRLLTHPERFIQPVSPGILEEESDEPELILEAHQQIALSLMNSLDLISGQITTASELLDQKLDSDRNKLLLANMLISVLSFCTTVVAIVGSFFGMNLKNQWEDSHDAFRQVCIGSSAGGLVLVLCIMSILFLTGTIPRL